MTRNNYLALIGNENSVFPRKTFFFLKKYAEMERESDYVVENVGLMSLHPCF